MDDAETLEKLQGRAEGAVRLHPRPGREGRNALRREDAGAVAGAALHVRDRRGPEDRSRWSPARTPSTRTGAIVACPLRNPAQSSRRSARAARTRVRSGRAGAGRRGFAERDAGVHPPLARGDELHQIIHRALGDAQRHRRHVQHEVQHRRDEARPRHTGRAEEDVEGALLGAEGALHRDVMAARAPSDRARSRCRGCAPRGPAGAWRASGARPRRGRGGAGRPA